MITFDRNTLEAILFTHIYTHVCIVSIGSMILFAILSFSRLVWRRLWTAENLMELDAPGECSLLST